MTLYGIVVSCAIIVILNFYLFLGVFRKNESQIWQWMALSSAAIWAILVFSFFFFGIEDRMGNMKSKLDKHYGKVEETLDFNVKPLLKVLFEIFTLLGKNCI